MKILIRVILFLLIVFLTWKIYRSIAGPLEYAAEVEVKERAIVEKLRTIREAQLAYKDIHNSFTADFDTLINFMKNGHIIILRAYGDKDDSTTVYRQLKDSVSVRDSLFALVDIDQIRFLPGSDTLQFLIQAGFITKNNVKVPVFQITDPDPFSKERRKEKDPLRVGNIWDVDYNGNWSKNL